MRLIAITDQGERLHIKEYIKEEHKGKIFCYEGHELVAKKGEKKTHHYSHKNDACECDRRMGEFHIWWQKRVKDNYLEKRYNVDGKLHIADIVNKNGTVIEIQKSKIPPKIIREREEFYGDMIWVFDCTCIDIHIIKQKKDVMLFEWVKGTRYLLEAKKPSFLDFGKRGVVELIKQKGRKMIGVIWTLEEFDNQFFNDILKIDHDKRDNRFSYNLKLRYESSNELYKIVKRLEKKM
jgi:hypothetical protein